MFIRDVENKNRMIERKGRVELIYNSTLFNKMTILSDVQSITVMSNMIYYRHYVNMHVIV